MCVGGRLRAAGGLGWVVTEKGAMSQTQDMPPRSMQQASDTTRERVRQGP